MAGTIMRSTQFRSIVEPILNQAFDGVYTQRKDEYKAIFAEEDGIKRAYHEEPVLFGFGNDGPYDATTNPFPTVLVQIAQHQYVANKVAI